MPGTLNKELFSALLAENKLDGYVATDTDNITYVSGLRPMSYWSRQVYVVGTAMDVEAQSVVIDTLLVDQLGNQNVFPIDVRRIGRFFVESGPDVSSDPCSERLSRYYATPMYANSLEALQASLSYMGLDSGRVGIDEQGLAPGLFEKLSQAFPSLTIIAASAIFKKSRAQKTEEEIRRLRQAVSITEESIAAALAACTIGISEQDMARVFHTRTIQEYGLPSIDSMAFGRRTAMPNVQPSSTSFLAEGDVVRFDVGCVFENYQADIARNFIFGEPDARMRTYHNAIYRGMQRAFELIRPGVSLSSVYDDVMETVRREGIPHYRRNHIGHGIGLSVYDIPLIAPNDGVFEENMVFCVETPYYELGSWGLQVEDTIVVRKDGIESLMRTDSRLRQAALS